MEITTTHPLISIIVPIYNASQWLKACLESILKQDYVHYQLLLINDGSTDESEEICHSFEDERIEYYCIPHCGVSAARNVGLKYAQGEYITFVDSDDLVHPLFLSTLMSGMIKYDVDVIGCRWTTINDCCEIYDDPLKMDNEMVYVVDGMQAIKECRLSNEVNGWVNTVVWNKLFKKEIAKSELFDPKFCYGEDTKWLWMVLAKTERYVQINDILYGYRKTKSEKAYFTPKNINQYYHWEYIYYQDLGMDETVLKAPLRAMNEIQLFVDIECYIEGDKAIKQEVLERWQIHSYETCFPPKKLGRIKLSLCLLLMIWGFPRNMVQWLYHLSM